MVATEKANQIAQDKNLAIALKRLNTLQRQSCFSPYDFESRPTPMQQQILDDISHYPHRYVLGGNQCKPAYSLVKMADGSLKPISEIVVGDLVAAFDKKTETQVVAPVIKVWSNGVKPVFRYHTGLHQHTDSTDNHKMIRYLGSKLVKSEIKKCKSLTRETIITKGEDSLDPKMVELLGYLLGDGCLRIKRPNGGWKGLQFTNTSEAILNYIKLLITPDYYWRDVGNGDYFLSKKTQSSLPNKYIEFIRELGLDNKLAYEKFIPSIIFKQSVETRRKFIAGLIATDGWIGSDGIIGFSSTSLQLAIDTRDILSSLGIYSTLKVKKRNKTNPNHRDEYTVQISREEYIEEFHRTITVISKPPKKRYSHINTNQWISKNIIKVESLGEMPVYDITIDHPDHIYICDGYYTGNSGKSAVGSRECAWIFTETHPTFVRPSSWKNMPLTMLIVGRTTAQVEELWNKKIRPFLDSGDYREVRIGGSLHKVVHRINGNYILFFSHHSPEEAREKIQSFDAHWLWLDEMPDSFRLLEELHRRCMAWSGRFIATFTPKLRNNEIKNIVDNVTPYQKTYRIGTLENPMYKGREEEVLAPLERMPEGYRNMILQGSWYTGDLAVYQFDSKMHCKELPENYSVGWRHVEAIDPAASSKAGYVILAEDPSTKKWHVVLADYIAGASAKVLLQEMEKKRNNVRIVKRISDPHESWFIKHAHEEGMTFVGVEKKNERKKELIKNVQIALDSRKVVISPWLSDLINEFATCQWSETADDRIVGSRRFHILDALQYAIDNLPKPETYEEPLTHNQWLRKANKERIKEEQQAKERKNSNPFGRIVARRGRMIRHG